MSNMIYKDDKSLKAIEDLIVAADKVMDTSTLILTGKNSESLAVGAAIGGSVGASIAGAGIVTIGTGTVGAVGASSLIGGSLAAGGTVLIAPIAIPAIIVSGIGYAIFKNKKKKEFENKKKAYYNKIIEKQNKLYEKIKTEMDRLEKENETITKINEGLMSKIREYEVLFEAMRKQRENLENDLSFA